MCDDFCDYNDWINVVRKNNKMDKIWKINYRRIRV